MLLRNCLRYRCCRPWIRVSQRLSPYLILLPYILSQRHPEYQLHRSFRSNLRISRKTFRPRRESEIRMYLASHPDPPRAMPAAGPRARLKFARAFGSFLAPNHHLHLRRASFLLFLSLSEGLLLLRLQKEVPTIPNTNTKSKPYPLVCYVPLALQNPEVAVRKAADNIPLLLRLLCFHPVPRKVLLHPLYFRPLRHRPQLPLGLHLLSRGLRLLGLGALI